MVSASSISLMYQYGPKQLQWIDQHVTYRRMVGNHSC